MCHSIIIDIDRDQHSKYGYLTTSGAQTNQTDPGPQSTSPSLPGVILLLNHEEVVELTDRVAKAEGFIWGVVTSLFPTGYKYFNMVTSRAIPVSTVKNQFWIQVNWALISTL